MKNIAILGSTGSIGTQTLDVIEKHSDSFRVEVLTANNSADLLIEQARKHIPNSVVISNKELYSYVSEKLEDLPIKVYSGEKALEEVVQSTTVDIVVSALVGYAGVIPTIRAIEAKKDIALANKEVLVAAGEIVSEMVMSYGSRITPIDSEHSAIFQSLAGEDPSEIEKIILTCSGGPFANYSLEQLKTVGIKEALNHPKWSMGNKITIDSATMVNKGFEIIEAKWLFDLDPDDIEVTIHKQSIIHSMVQFKDGSVKAQMGTPDMRSPISYALTAPNRLKLDVERIDFKTVGSLTFEEPNTEVFDSIKLAYEVLRKGGNLAAAFNAANEVAVSLFLNSKINFTDIFMINRKVVEQTDFIVKPNIEDIIKTDSKSRELANSIALNLES